ncbi:MAG TPA: CsgG/HfaB family protein, partial [bacterium]|nr:CsgG/HfaB family protein [bacterium]
MKTNRIVASLAVVAALAACAPTHRTQFRAAPTALEPVTCVAVLPFENLTGEAAAGDAMADLVATELIKSGRFQVMDRAESARILATRGIYLGATVDASQARMLGDVLGVQAVVLGAVDEWRYRTPERHDREPRASIGVTTRLVDVKTGDALWGATFSGSPASFASSATPPLHVAAQRVAMDLSSGLLEGAGNAHPGEKPCWSDRAQSVLATLAPSANGHAVASATTSPAATPAPSPKGSPLFLSSTPTPAPTAVAMASPAPTVAATPAATATPIPVASTKPLSATQGALLDKMKAGATFVLDGVTFVGLTANLAETSNTPIADFAAVLAAHPEAHVRLEAHVDPTDPAPVPLSQKRAEVVVAKLVADGASATQADPKGMGGTKALFPSFVEAMKAKNRRVEIVVTAAPKTAAVASATNNTAPQEARVKVLASKGQSASAVKLANALKQTGTKVTAVAAVPEERKQTLVYFLPAYKDQAQKLAGS